MADYTLQATWSTKDALATGTALKAISATELGTEFTEIAARSADKYDSADLASQAEAEGLSDTAKIVTPERLNDVLVDNAGILGDLQALADPAANLLLGWNDTSNAAVTYANATNGGIAFAAGTIKVDLSDLATETTAASGDFIPMEDITDNLSMKITRANLNGSFTLAALSDYDANEQIDHTGVTITAGTGLTGGGTIAATRTLNVIGTAPIVEAANAVTFDISGLSELTAANMSGSDTFLIDDGDGGTNKKITFSSIGPDIKESNNSPSTLDHGNRMYINSGSIEDTVTIPANASIAYPIGTQFGFGTTGSAAIVVAVTSDTLTSLDSLKQVRAAGGGAYLVKVAATEWLLVGDLEA
jgi:hypothetical protein